MAIAGAEGIFFDRARETRNPERRRVEHEELLQKILAHARVHSRAYKEIFQQAGLGPDEPVGLEDLHRLPIVRLSDLALRQKKDPPFGGFDAAPESEIGRVYVNPGFIWQPGERTPSDTSWAEGLCGAGITRGDRVVNTFNYHLWPYAFMLDESARGLGATVVPTGVGNTLMQIKVLDQFRVTGFMGTPSYLSTLVQRAEGSGLDVRKDLALRKAMVGAEMLPESLRRRLEDTLGITVRQTYGTVFLGCLGYECPHENGLHVPENTIIEIVDPKTGRPVEEGAAGEIVASVYSRVHPLVRFATGDLSLFKRGSCPCGRTGYMLERVLGRVDQATKVRGTFVHPWQTDAVMARFPEAFKYMVVIDRPGDEDEMKFIVELREETAESGIIRGRIERDIKEFLGLKGAVEIVPRGTIPDFHKKIEDRRSWQ